MGNFNLKDRTQAEWSMQKFSFNPKPKIVLAKLALKMETPKQDITAIDLSRVVKDIEAAAKAALALFQQPLNTRRATDLVRKN